MSDREAREKRLKSALKANLGRRKAQARARADAPEDDPSPQTDTAERSETGARTAAPHTKDS